MQIYVIKLNQRINFNYIQINYNFIYEKTKSNKLPRGRATEVLAK